MAFEEELKHVKTALQNIAAYPSQTTVNHNRELFLQLESLLVHTPPKQFPQLVKAIADNAPWVFEYIKDTNDRNALHILLSRYTHSIHITKNFEEELPYLLEALNITLKNANEACLRHKANSDHCFGYFVRCYSNFVTTSTSPANQAFLEQKRGELRGRIFEAYSDACFDQLKAETVWQEAGEGLFPFDELLEQGVDFVAPVREGATYDTIAKSYLYHYKKDENLNLFKGLFKYFIKRLLRNHAEDPKRGKDILSAQLTRFKDIEATFDAIEKLGRSRRIAEWLVDELQLPEYYKTLQTTELFFPLMLRYIYDLNQGVGSFYLVGEFAGETFSEDYIVAMKALLFKQNSQDINNNHATLTFAEYIKEALLLRGIDLDKADRQYRFEQAIGNKDVKAVKEALLTQDVNPHAPDAYGPIAYSAIFTSSSPLSPAFLELLLSPVNPKRQDQRVADIKLCIREKLTLAKALPAVLNIGLTQSELVTKAMNWLLIRAIATWHPKTQTDVETLTAKLEEYGLKLKEYGSVVISKEEIEAILNVLAEERAVKDKKPHPVVFLNRVSFLLHEVTLEEKQKHNPSYVNWRSAKDNLFDYQKGMLNPYVLDEKGEYYFGALLSNKDKTSLVIEEILKPLWDNEAAKAASTEELSRLLKVLRKFEKDQGLCSIVAEKFKKQGTTLPEWVTRETLTGWLLDLLTVRVMRPAIPAQVGLKPRNIEIEGTGLPKEIDSEILFFDAPEQRTPGFFYAMIEVTEAKSFNFGSFIKNAYDGLYGGGAFDKALAIKSLYEAIGAGEVEKVKSLLSKEVPLFSRYPHEAASTPVPNPFAQMQFYSRHASEELCEVLLAHGADPFAEAFSQGNSYVKYISGIARREGEQIALMAHFLTSPKRYTEEQAKEAYALIKVLPSRHFIYTLFSIDTKQWAPASTAAQLDGWLRALFIARYFPSKEWRDYPALLTEIQAASKALQKSGAFDAVACVKAMSVAITGLSLEQLIETEKLHNAVTENGVKFQQAIQQAIAAGANINSPYPVERGLFLRHVLDYENQLKNRNLNILFSFDIDPNIDLKTEEVPFIASCVLEKLTTSSTHTLENAKQNIAFALKYKDVFLRIAYSFATSAYAAITEKQLHRLYAYHYLKVAPKVSLEELRSLGLSLNEDEYVAVVSQAQQPSQVQNDNTASLSMSDVLKGIEECLSGEYTDFTEKFDLETITQLLKQDKEAVAPLLRERAIRTEQPADVLLELERLGVHVGALPLGYMQQDRFFDLLLQEIYASDKRIQQRDAFNLYLDDPYVEPLKDALKRSLEQQSITLPRQLPLGSALSYIVKLPATVGNTQDVNNNNGIPSISILPLKQFLYHCMSRTPAYSTTIITNNILDKTAACDLREGRGIGLRHQLQKAYAGYESTVLFDEDAQTQIAAAIDKHVLRHIRQDEELSITKKFQEKFSSTKEQIYKKKDLGLEAKKDGSFTVKEGAPLIGIFKAIPAFLKARESNPNALLEAFIGKSNTQAFSK